MVSEKVRAVSDAFNARAAKEGWVSTCDPQLEFRHQAPLAMLGVWREKVRAQTSPSGREFSSLDIGALQRDIAIYERIASSGGGYRYRVKLMGATFAATMGDLSGKFLDEAIPVSFLPRWYAALDATLDAGAPLRFVTRSDTANKKHLVAEYFEAPLLDEDGEATMIVAASYFGSAESWLKEPERARAV